MHGAHRCSINDTCLSASALTPHLHWACLTWDWVTLLVERVGFRVPTGHSFPVRETSIAYKSMRANVGFGKAQLAAVS